MVSAQRGCYAYVPLHISDVCAIAKNIQNTNLKIHWIVTVILTLSSKDTFSQCPGVLLTDILLTSDFGFTPLFNF